MKKTIYSAAILIFALIISSATCKKGENENEPNPRDVDLRGGEVKRAELQLDYMVANKLSNIYFLLTYDPTPYAKNKKDNFSYWGFNDWNAKLWKSSSAPLIEPTAPMTIKTYNSTMGDFTIEARNIVPDTFMATKFGRTVQYIIPKDSAIVLYGTAFLSTTIVTLDSVRRTANKLANTLVQSNNYLSNVVN